jgi:DNA-binding transcriptional LysR family regulator
VARLQLAELTAFVAVAECRSFSKAAAQVGIAPPTMSQTIRALEARLGVRLFNRTTRSVALTEAGERLLAEVHPILSSVEHALESVNLFRDKPVGTLRLAVERPAAAIITANHLSPLVQPFLAEYPGIRLEIAIDDAHGDIVSGRFDAGIRLGNRIERDMTILRMLDESRMVMVAAPDYLARNPAPSAPRDLLAHNCVRYRLPWEASVRPWVFTRGDETLEIAVDGSLVVNDIGLGLSNVLDGVGVGYMPETIVASHVARGRLAIVLEAWSRTLPGIYLYHPSRRQTPTPLQVFIRFVENWRKHARPLDRQ